MHFIIILIINYVLRVTFKTHLTQPTKKSPWFRKNAFDNEQYLTLQCNKTNHNPKPFNIWAHSESLSLWNVSIIRISK
jgi:hypothetical protein